MSAADRTAHLLDPIRVRLARSPLPGWGRDSLRALASLLPARWRRLVEAEDQRLFLARADGVVNLIATGEQGDIALGWLPLDDAGLLETARIRLDESAAARWLLLPASMVLRRSLMLPAAAEPRLHEVLGFELDRQTPFTADQAGYRGRVVSRDAATQQIQVELLVMPRARLDAELAALGPLAQGLVGVDVAEADGRRLGLSLLPDARRDRRADPVARLNAALAGAAFVALLATLLLTLFNRDQKLEEMRALVEAATVEARQARLLRNQLESSALAANFLATTRASRPTMLEVLDDLTRRIPDDTSLDKLAINDGRLVMVGQSRAAPALVGLLQASELLADPALSGAVQADPRTGRDRFTLTARVREQASAEAADAPNP